MPVGSPFDTQGYGVGDTFVAATVASGSSTPTVRSRDVKGGLMQVADLAARDAIPDQAAARDSVDQFRQEGMLCFVQSNQSTYQLRGGITNADWVLFGQGGIAGLDVVRTSDDAGTLDQGMIVAQSQATAQRIVRCNPTLVTPSEQSETRPVGVVIPVQIATLTAGAIRIAHGAEVPVRIVAGLVLPSYGEEVLLSTTEPGACTFPGLTGTPAPGSGHVLQRVGIFLDELTYDGGADRLVLMQTDFGQRRIA